MQALLRFTLDLFDRGQAAPATPAPRSGKRKKAEKPPFQKQNTPSAQSNRAQPAIENIADEALQHGSAAPLLPPQTLQESLLPATSRHPRATREVLLGGVHVAYEFRRGQRRTIGFSVGPEGLAVRAPKWVPLYEVDRAVQEKSDWIFKNLK